MIPMLNVSYRKVGGLRFVRIGKLGFSWYITNKPARTHDASRTYPNGDVMLPPLKRGGPILDDVKYYREYEGGSTVVVYRDR